MQDGMATGAFDAIILAGGRARRLGGAAKPEVLVAGRRLLDHALDATAGARRTVVVGPATTVPVGVMLTREDPAGSGPVAAIEAGLRTLAAGPRVLGGGQGSPDGRDGAPEGRDGAPGGEAALEGGECAPGGEPAPEGGECAPGGEPAPEGEEGEPALVLVLACDTPRAGGAVPALLAAAARSDVDGAVLLDASGRHQPLVAVYRRSALAAAADRLAADGSLTDASMRSLLCDLTIAQVEDGSGFSDDADTWSDVDRLDAQLRGN